MSEKQEDKRRNRDKRRLIFYPARIVSVLILSILFITIIGHFWLIPAKVNWEIEQAFSKFWDGQVDIEGIEVNYFHPINLAKVRFFNKAGRECICARMVKIALINWPSLHPVVTGIEIDRLNIQIQPEDKKLNFPIVYPYEHKSNSTKTIDIRLLAINELDISINDVHGTKSFYGNLQFQAIKKGSFYEFVLNRFGTVAEESLLARGRVDSKTLETEVLLQIKHAVQKPGSALAFSALNISNLSADGKLEADLTITGCLKKPSRLEPNGIASFEGWTLVKNDKIIANNLTTKVNVSNGRYILENITANVCEGSVTGSLFIEIRQNQPTEFSGQVLAQNMSFAELTSVLGGSGKRATKGSVSFNYKFSGKGKDLQNVIGEGQIFLDDADISVIPIVPQIFSNIGLTQPDVLKMSDAECTFSMAETIAIIESAHIGNRFAAIKAEPGGTINLKTKQINIYVKAVLLKQIDAIIKRIPIVNIIDNLKDKLTRLNIQGNWSDPPSKLIKKEPIKDIKEATVGFLQDVVNSGGQITQEMRKRFGNFSKPK